MVAYDANCNSLKPLWLTSDLVIARSVVLVGYCAGNIKLFSTYMAAARGIRRTFGPDPGSHVPVIASSRQLLTGAKWRSP